MIRNKPWTAVSKALVDVTVMLIVTLVLASGAAASEYKILHTFTWAKNPMGNLIMDAAGNLYGTTQEGPGTGCGGSGCGTVYKLAPSANGTWKVSTLHVFGGACGANPNAGVIFDAAGNIYGTTVSGGAYGYGVGGGIHGYGVVFKLTPNPNGTWTESVLYNFGVGQADGREPAGELTFDGVGNLYGMTQYGGQSGAGTVFKLAHNPDGTWTESVLYSFTGNGQDELFPYAGLIFDAAGNLYGTTRGFSEGGVFKLTPDPDGTWTESVLYAFPAGAGTPFPDGASPYGGVVLDSAGNLYGTALGGGPYGYGVVFKLAPNLDGTWTESTLYSFTGTDGSYPKAGLILDAIGNLYGTTLLGAAGYGVVFKLAPNLDGTWTESVLHTFTGYGARPEGGVIMDAAGNLYGTTNSGNPKYDYGLVFEITP